MLLGIITTSTPEATVGAFEGTKVDLYYAPDSLAVDRQSAETGVPLLSTEIDKGGNLILVPVPTGSFVMLVHLPEKEVVIEELTIDQE